MRVKVYGSRGSYPVCRRNVVRYGGNTTCWLLESGNEVVIIDGGSGIVSLGRELVTRYPEGRTIHICLTHPHWDHMLGLPFFEPIFKSHFSIIVHGADSENKPLESVLATQHKEDSFPVSFNHLPSNISFDRLQPGDTRCIGHITVSTLQLNHPGMDLGYRFETDRSIFVFFTDLAPIAGNYLGAGMTSRAEGREAAFERDYWASLVAMTAGADLVLHDTNFTDKEIEGHMHWGHSTPSQALELLAQHATPPALILSHHDPGHSDTDMDDIYELAKNQGKEHGVEVLIAKEGGVYQL